MKSPKPIINNLFRFISLRTPQLINPQKKEFGFIYHPSPNNSHFLSKTDASNIKSSRNSVLEVLGAFKAVGTYKDIREINPELYDFGLWLAKNRKKLAAQNMVLKGQNISTLKQAEVITIWDNLFAQLLKRNNGSLRQACNLMLLAHNFVTKTQTPSLINAGIQLYDGDKNRLTNDDKKAKLIKRLAKAKIVVPKAFSVEKHSWKSKEGNSERKEYDSLELEPLEKYSRTARLKQNNRDLTDVQRSIKKMVSKSVAENRNIEVSQFLTKNKITKANGGKVYKYLSKPNLQNKKVTELNTILNNDITNNNRSYRNANEQVIRDKGRRKTKGKISISDVSDYCYAIQFDYSKIEGHVFVVSFKVPSRLTSIESLDISISAGGANLASSQEFEEIQYKNNIYSFLLFPDQTINLRDSADFTLSGNITFTSGRYLEINKTIKTGSKTVYGCPNETGNELPGTNYDFEEGVPLYGVNRVGVGVFRRVEQEVCCYVPGEVSRVENIMAREYKERHTRSLTSTEDIEEESSEYEIENQTDTATTLRNEIQTEVAKVIDKNTNIGTGASVGVNGKYPGGLVEVSADAYLDFAMANASSESDSEAKDFAEEITNAAVERILQRTSQKRTSKIVKEFEENNRHGFDNREGNQHITGVYRWLDIIYTNRLVNYGNRLMVEFLIPEPARLYKDSVLAKFAPPKVEVGEDGEEVNNGPTHPSDLEEPILSFEDVNEGNYLELGRIYNVDLPEPITPEEFVLSKTFNPSSDPNGNPDPNAKAEDYSFSLNFNETQDLTKYSAYEVKVDFNFDYHLKTGFGRTETGTYFILKVHNNTKSYDKGNLSDSEGTSRAKSKNKSSSKTYDLPDIKNALPITVDCKNVYDFSLNVQVFTKLDDQEVINWQSEVYDTIIRAWEDMQDEYEKEEEALVEESDEAISNLGSGNPTMNRAIEQRELQRIAIEMLTSPFYDASAPYKNRLGADFYEYNKCDGTIPSVKQTQGWETYSSHVKFFEQAFDWKLMAYLFYPYYWAKKCDWMELMSIEDVQDTIFKGFLQSGMARMVVPVRKGFHDAVNYYFETGDIWNGGDLVLDTDDDLYLSIDEELQEPEGFVDEEWETRVPTTLTIIQGDSVFLEDEGLPCCHKLEEDTDTLLRGTNAVLGDLVEKGENTEPQA